MQDRGTHDAGAALAYSPTARRLHWWTVAFLIVQIPLGFAMVNWEGLPGSLYTSHKLIGMIFLLLILARLAYRLAHGAPADEPTLNVFEKIASHVTHWTLYGLLLLVPFLGWLGVSYYDARDIFGLISIPAITAKDTDFAGKIFFLHKVTAVAVIVLAGMHIAAALMHYVVKKDGVLARMLPSAGRRQ